MNPVLVTALIAAGSAIALAGLGFLAYWGFEKFSDRRVSRYQNSLLRQHYDEVQNIYQTMRGWRHDYHNHIQMMKALIELGRYSELDGYLDQLDRDLRTIDRVVKTGNLMLDAILNSKISLARTQGIEINAKATVPQELNVSDVDLCVMVGNLLDNAVEGCLRLADEKARFIRVYVDVLKGQLYLSVTNATGEGRRVREYRTAKGEGHGFGLRRVDAIVRKYGGYVNRQNEPFVFATEIMLPLA